MMESFIYENLSRSPLSRSKEMIDTPLQSTHHSSFGTVDGDTSAYTPYSHQTMSRMRFRGDTYQPRKLFTSSELDDIPYSVSQSNLSRRTLRPQSPQMLFSNSELDNIVRDFDEQEDVTSSDPTPERENHDVEQHFDEGYYSSHNTEETPSSLMSKLNLRRSGLKHQHQAQIRRGPSSSTSYHNQPFYHAENENYDPTYRYNNPIVSSGVPPYANNSGNYFVGHTPQARPEVCAKTVVTVERIIYYVPVDQHDQYYGPQQPAPNYSKELQKPLTTADHFKVCQRLRTISNEQLIRLGTALGLEYPNLRRMKNLPDDMVNAWLIGADNVVNTSGPASWESLITALCHIGQQGIASAIQRDETATTNSLQRSPLPSFQHVRERTMDEPIESYVYS